MAVPTVGCVRSCTVSALMPYQFLIVVVGAGELVDRDVRVGHGRVRDLASRVATGAPAKFRARRRYGWTPRRRRLHRLRKPVSRQWPLESTSAGSLSAELGKRMTEPEQLLSATVREATACRVGAAAFGAPP